VRIGDYITSSTLQQLHNSSCGSSSAVAAGTAAASSRSLDYKVTPEPMPYLEHLLNLGSLVLPGSSERL
jgi:hypothetical protein